MPKLFSFVTVPITLNEPGGWELPSTGGTGTLVLTIIGLALIGCALILLVVRRKDE